MLPPINQIIIETISSCNRRCASCFRQTYPIKDNKSHVGRFPVTSTAGVGVKMPMPTIRKIINDAIDFGFKGCVQLQYFNEPLLDDRLVKICEYLKSKSEIQGYPRVSVKPGGPHRDLPPVYFFSNLDLMTAERATELDGKVDLIIGTLYMPLDAARDRSLKIYKMFSHTDIMLREGTHYTSHFSPFHDLQLNIQKVRSEPCTHFNDMLIIRYDGTVLHCCEDYAGEFNLGNINDLSVKEIWTGRTHRGILDTLSRGGGRRVYKHCRICPRNNINCERMKPVYEAPHAT